VRVVIGSRDELGFCASCTGERECWECHVERSHVERSLNLKLDGQEISTDNIFIGQGRNHPPTNPFRIEI
jgi:hypothetical protein